MSIEISKLKNGLRVVSHRMPHVETVSLGIWVGVGARSELRAEHGVSHFLEHMAFKGTGRRSARRIAEEIEEIGGELNAATSLENTAYYARTLKGDEGVALEILADILQNSRFAPDELERERHVILQEIAATRDSPEEMAYDLFLEAAFPGQAVGRPILGTTASVKRFSSSDLKSFLKRHYGASRMIVSAAGAVDHKRLVRHAEAVFGGLNGSQGPDLEPASFKGAESSSDKPFEQSHIILGFESPSYRSPDFYAAQVFSGLFGGGMSSRLFQEVREKRGLCYSIYSTCWGLSDTGLFAIHSATGKAALGKLIEVVKTEIERIAERRPPPTELARAKAQLKAGLLMSLESTSGRAEQMARQLLAFDRLLATEELIAKVEEVTPKAITDFVAGMITEKRPSIAVVGAGRRAKGYAEMLQGIGTA